MKEQEHNELEMRESKAPWPESLSELADYINSLVEGEHDYGTCVYAMSLSAHASFNYIAKELGVTGFQAGCASMDLIARIKSLKEQPFAIIKGENMLYPQYNLRADFEKLLKEWRKWAGEEALKKLKHWLYHQNCDCDGKKKKPSISKCFKGRVSRQVVAHWMSLAGMEYLNHWQRTFMCKHHVRRDYPCICGREHIANEDS